MIETRNAILAGTVLALLSGSADLALAKDGLLTVAQQSEKEKGAKPGARPPQRNVPARPAPPKINPAQQQRQMQQRQHPAPQHAKPPSAPSKPLPAQTQTPRRVTPPPAAGQRMPAPAAKGAPPAQQKPQRPVTTGKPTPNTARTPQNQPTTPKTPPTRFGSQPQAPLKPGQPQLRTVQPPAGQARKPAFNGPVHVMPRSANGRPLGRIDDLRRERREEKQGNRTIIHEADRTIIRENGRFFVRHNDVDRFRFRARHSRVDRRGNEVFNYIDRPDGTVVIIVTDGNGRLLRRLRRGRDGREIVIIDNTRRAGFIAGAGSYFVDLPPPVLHIPRDRYIVDAESADPDLLYDTLTAPPVDRIEQAYSLDEVRFSPALRERMRSVDINTVNFETGSWELSEEQIDKLSVIAEVINRAIQKNPAEVFLIEGHTDAVGDEVDNMSLSDRRAESVAVALSEQFGVPAENLVTQGYGEQFLKVQTQGPERANRRVTVRRITPLLNGEARSGGAN